MTQVLSFRVNGRARRVAGVDPHTTLLSYLRSAGLTAAKEGCAEGECGACAVVFVENDSARGPRFEAVNACLIMLPAVDGRSIYTAEGIGQSGALHPVQEALVAAGGSQCGYCTPGFVVSLFAHYYRAPRGEVSEALSGNLCRCTGYRPIRDAARALPEPHADDAFRVRLREEASASTTTSMRYEAAEVRFDRPTSLAEALALRAEFPNARVVNGGTDLTVELNQRHVRHGHWLALDAVEELKSCELTESAIVLGAGLTIQALGRALSGEVPLIAELVPLFASLPLRTRATLGGNLVTASPVGDGAPVLLALDAELELASQSARRRIPLREFFTGYRTTALAPDELLVAVHLARAQPSEARFYKVTKRPIDDISAVAAAFAITRKEGVVTKARLAFGGVAPTPLRALAAEAELEGKSLDEKSAAGVRAELERAFVPIGDQRASAAYRRALVVSLWDKFVAEVLV